MNTDRSVIKPFIINKVEIAHILPDVMKLFPTLFKVITTHNTIQCSRPEKEFFIWTLDHQLDDENGAPPFFMYAEKGVSSYSRENKKPMHYCRETILGLVA